MTPQPRTKALIITGNDASLDQIRGYCVQFEECKLIQTQFVTIQQIEDGFCKQLAATLHAYFRGENPWR